MRENLLERENNGFIVKKNDQPDHGQLRQGTPMKFLKEALHSDYPS